MTDDLFPDWFQNPKRLGQTGKPNTRRNFCQRCGGRTSVWEGTTRITIRCDLTRSGASDVRFRICAPCVKAGWQVDSMSDTLVFINYAGARVQIEKPKDEPSA